MGLTQPAAGRPRAARVCLAFPIARPRRRALPRHRPARPGPRAPSATEARAALGIGPASAACSCSAARSAPARINDAAVAGVRRRALPRAPHRRPPRLPRPDARPARTTTCATTSTPFGRALAAADLAVARAGGSIFELAQYGAPRGAVPYPHATADHQTANARWMEQGGAAIVIARRRAHARAAARRRRRDPARRRAAARRWPPRRRGWRGRTPRATSPARCSRRPRTGRLGSRPHSSIRRPSAQVPARSGR